MLSSKKIFIFLTVFAALLLAGCVSLAGDVTPPPNYVPPTPVPEQPVVSKTVFPIVPPDPAQGAVIFAAKCQPCHGQRGMGDGPQAASLPNPPAAIGSADLAHKSRPVDWYQTVTTGNLEKFMPGFSGSLDDRQRWDVISYVYTLSTSQDELAQGKALYDANCASCHGQTGKGDGTQSASLKTPAASWVDQSKLAPLSADDLVQLFQNGKGEMPAYQGKLDSAQSYAVAAYIRTLGFASAGQDSQQASTNTTAGSAAADATQTAPAGSPTDATPQAADLTPGAQQTITLTGKVTNGTPGGKVPEGLKINLSAYDGMNAAFEESADAASDGSYRFENVKFADTYVYFATTTVGDLTFNSNILHASDVKGKTGDLPLQIYESTTDTSTLTASRLHIFFDFTKSGQVQVVNLYIISNPTDRVVVAKQKGQTVLNFELPKEASNLQFQDGVLGQRFIQTDSGFGDTAAIQPGTAGQNQLLFAYDLPYENGLDLNIKMPLPVDAATVMVPPQTVGLKSGQLIDQGQQDVQGMSFHMYQAAAKLASGDTLKLSLSGKPGPSAAGGTTGNEKTYLLIGLGAFGLVLVGAGVWLWWRRRLQVQAEGVGDLEMAPDERSSETSESLLDAIVALDDQHASGSLPDAAYQERRADLKSRLADALLRERKG